MCREIFKVCLAILGRLCIEGLKWLQHDHVDLQWPDIKRFSIFTEYLTEVVIDRKIY